MINRVSKFFEQDGEVKKEFYTRDQRPFLYNSNYNLSNTPTSTWKDSFFCDLAPIAPKPQDLPDACRDHQFFQSPYQATPSHRLLVASRTRTNKEMEVPEN